MRRDGAENHSVPIKFKIDKKYNNKMIKLVYKFDKFIHLITLTKNTFDNIDKKYI